MSRISKKKKKSTSKYRELKISPLIPIVAIIEVLVLIGVSTFAWFYMSTNKSAEIGTIGVEADSGLDIDFKYAKEDDYINIWNYIDKETFSFEPVTSLDGRNVFVPTTGTFDNTNTSDMVFREGTVNDINSKYINVDFELTNTTDYDMKVFLNNNSYFYVKNGQDNDESRALRLAFYPNDASVGDVSSQLIGGSEDYANQEEHQTTGTVRTVYFDNTNWDTNPVTKKWDKVYAYLWKDSGDKPKLAAWPGTEMSRFSGPIYKLTYTEDPNEVYDKIIFTDGNGHQTNDLTFNDNHVYSAADGGTDLEAFNAKTVYFVKPNTWDNVYVHAWRNNGADQFYTNWNNNNASGLDEMTHVGSGIYSYTFNGSSGDTGVYKLIFTNGNWGRYNQTKPVDIKSQTPDVDGNVYYIDNETYYDNGYKYSVAAYSKKYSQLTSKTIYFYNTLGWDIPYCTGAVNTGNATYTALNTINVAMTSLTGNVYYCNLPEIYSSAYFRDRDDDSKRTISVPDGEIPLTNGYVYRTLNTKTGNYYNLNCFEYSQFTDDDGFAVISPGVSAGFQRTYSPVVSIDNQTGAVSQVIPAFASSIDNYIYGNTAGTGGTAQTVFEIKSHNVLSLSLVIWLEGTDPSCTASNYAAKDIALRLEFASSYTKVLPTEEPGQEPATEVVNVNTYGSENYTYKFYDKTREVWTSDRQTTESGITVAPVMQLYDNTMERGYLMQPDKFVTVDGKTKVSCWKVDAPQNIALWGHDIIFRRVNPYNENEVWNYWHAGRVAGAEGAPVYTDRKNTNRYSIYDCAFSNGNTISFTAFSDSGPTDQMLQDNDANYTAGTAGVPAVSSGGLWGNHNVRTLTVVDGYQGTPLKNDGGMLDIQYKFNYTVNGTAVRTADIEYKASGPYSDCLYYFVVPDVLYTATDPVKNYRGLLCKFKNYKDYTSSYATNSEFNTLKFRQMNNRWNYVTPEDNVAPTGDYFQLTETANHAGQYSYWGSDILYVRTTNATSDYMRSGSDVGSLMQVEYTDGSHTKYSYMYGQTHSDLKGNAPSAFVSVVPNKYRYNKYKIMDVKWGQEDTHYYSTGQLNINVSRSDTVDARSSAGYGSSNYTILRNDLGNNNLLTLDHMYIRIYIEIQEGLGLLSADNPDIHLWNGGGNSTTFQMTYDGKAGSYYRYYASFNVPEYTRFCVYKHNDSNTKSQDYVYDLNPQCNYNVYQIRQDNNWYPDHIGNGITDWSWSGDKTLVCATTGPSTIGLPHYAAPA